MKTHDYTLKCWGHDCIVRPVDGGMKLDLTGWGDGLRTGDFILLRNGTGSSRYRLDAVRYEYDPPDMWHATASFAPRSADELEADARRGVPVEGANCA